MLVPVFGAIVFAGALLTYRIIRSFVKDKKFAVFGSDIAYWPSGAVDVRPSSPDLIASLKSEAKLSDAHISEGTSWRADFQHYKEWKRAFYEADIVLYCVPLAKILPSDPDSMIEQRISDDAGQFSRWIKEKRKRYPCVVVGIMDYLPEDLLSLSRERVVELTNKVCDIPAIKSLITALGGEKGVITVCGRLTPSRNAGKLVQTILLKVKEFGKIGD